MRTSNYSQILFDALQYSGNDRQNITADTFAQFRDFSNARMREAWEANNWADICRIVSFTTTVDVNNVTYFTPATGAGEILAVFTKNPQETTKAVQLSYQLYDDGTNKKVILNTAIVEGWYLYRLACPVLTGDLYSPSVVYYQGVQAYFDSGSGTGSFTPVVGKPHAGNFYTCTVSSTSAGQNPNTHPTLWVKTDIPYIFSSFMAWASAANWLVSEGQIQEAVTIDAKAKEVLDMEYDKSLRQQSQFGRINMTNTY
jgi:hypothetical protein